MHKSHAMLAFSGMEIEVGAMCAFYLFLLVKIIRAMMIEGGGGGGLRCYGWPQ